MLGRQFGAEHLVMRNARLLGRKRVLSAYFSTSILVPKSVNEIDLSKIDEKWLKRWEAEKQKGFGQNKGDKFYILSMFPYPSGILHMGHFRVYTINDVLARYHRYKNRRVISPMGWDSFGLPAENAAIQRNVNPKDWTNSNISKMKAQVNRMLTTFDWEREISTCDPRYYKFTQMIFLWLYNHGLAYKNLKEINWDPVDKTVLANEQVDSNGKSWRSGAVVEKKVLNQWFLKITDYANELNDDLERLKNWPEKVKLMQKNWLGKSKGASIKFKIKKNISDGQLEDSFVEVFTSRPDTLFGAQYLALAIDHPVAKALSKSNAKLEKFIEDAKEQEKQNSFNYENSSLAAKNKAGFKLSEISVTNPLQSNEIPVFVAPYVLSGYGNGAIMGVPGHDQRDWEFWAQNCPGEKPIKVIDPVLAEESKDLSNEPYTGKSGKLNENCGDEFAGLTPKEAQKKIVQLLNSKGLGSFTTNFKLRDWLISRQRYWGCPIPIVYCDDCGMVPVPEDQLPVRLPENIQFSGKGNPLDSHEEFKNCKCPKCNKDAKRETDTMDTFMDSSWYFFRYIDSLNTKEPFSKSLVDKYGPVDLYIGGVEHAILHLLYARFISKFLAKIGKWNGGDLNGEPFTRLVSQGMVHGKTYIHPKTSKFLQPQELDLTDLTNPKLVEVDPSTGEALVPEITYEKMSKSKFNGVDPVECMEKYGADSARAHMLFLAPLDMILLWDESKISGIQRWLKKLVNMNTAIVDRFAAELQKQGFKNSSLDTILSNNETYLKSHEFNESEINLFNTVQQYVGLIDKAFGKDLSMNTAISDYMKLTNTISSEITNGNADINLLFNSYYKLILIVSPVCPAITEELWEILQQKLGISTWTSIFKQHWPEQLPVKESPYTEFSVMINGKFKFKHKALRSLIDKSENEITEEIVRECPNEKDKALLTEGKIKKTIIKPKAICYVLQK